MNSITIFDAPVMEFKTYKAAEKYSKRVIGGAKVVKASKSFFDPLWNKAIFQVFQSDK